MTSLFSEDSEDSNEEMMEEEDDNSEGDSDRSVACKKYADIFEFIENNSFFRSNRQKPCTLKAIISIYKFQHRRTRVTGGLAKPRKLIYAMNDRKDEDEEEEERQKVGRLY